MECSDTYNSILEPSKGLYKELGSRFIALAYPVETEAEVKALLDIARRQYHDARHHCYAFRLGLDGQTWRAGDDGEPSGSAGRQILGQIDSAGLSDVLVIVVRYFGGIKLGIPGLIRAYRTSTSDALSNASVITRTAGAWYGVSFAYETLPSVMKILKDMDLPARNQDFGLACSVQVRVRLALTQDFLDRMEKIGIFKDKIEKL